MVGGGHILRTNHNDEAIIAITEQIRKIREENARRHSRDYSHVFRPKSRWDLTRLACILVGIEFAYAAETAFVSPILLEIGIEHKLMTMVWSLSPMLGFLVGPLLGSISDRCRLRLGRRRPIIMGLCILILFGLVLVPWGKTFSIMLDKEYPIVQEFNVTESLQNLTTPRSMSLKLEPRVLRWATVFTVLGTVMLDFAADTVQTPARTYLLDVCLPSDQAKGLSTYTIMAGFGGFFGYSLGGINWNQTNIGLFLGGNIKTVFTIVTVVFIITALITLTSFREVPLGTMEKDDLLKPITDICIQSALVKDKNKNAIYNIRDASNNVVSINNELKNEMPSNTVTMENGTIEKDLDKEEHLTLMKYMKSIVVMPKSLKILCLTNLLSWMGHVCYCLYFTDFVGEAVFNGNPSGDLSEAGKQSFDAGVRFGCWGMAIYALSCSFYSMIIEILIKYLGARLVYIAGLLAFGFSMILLAAIPTKITVLLLSIPAGIIYSTVFTIPYLIIANYHAKNSFKSKNGENIPLKRPRGLGTDVAVISSMMFVAQICVSLTVGSMISATGHINVVIYAAGTFSILAAIAATKIQYLDL